MYIKSVSSVVAALLASALFAQAQPRRPQFDAASIRVNQSADRPFTRYDAGRVELHKASRKHIVRRAWPVPDYLIVWPDWVGGQRGAIGYDVSVTFPRDTTPENLQLMFQDLLATRFGLAMHWEPKELKVFEVGVSGSAKLHEAANPAPPTDYPKYSAGTQKGEWHLSSKLGAAPSGLTVPELMEVLTNLRVLDRPLIDATGIKGYYDIDLTAPVELPENKPAQSEVLAALDKQLGLKAIPKTRPVQMLIIDHLEKTPTEN